MKKMYIHCSLWENPQQVDRTQANTDGLQDFPSQSGTPRFPAHL